VNGNRRSDAIKVVGFIVLVMLAADVPKLDVGASAIPGLTVSPSGTAETPVPSKVAKPVYGSAINADTLANTQVGGQDNSARAMTSYRFRAGHSAALGAIRFYLQDGDGYSAGTGGTLEVSLTTDDGTTDHFPTDTVLARMTFVPGNPIKGRMDEHRFPSPPILVAGQLYHLVFRNADPDPGANFVSVNALFVDGPALVPRQPGLADEDWAQLLDQGQGWQVRGGFTPILELTYADGVQGVGYMEVWSQARKTISACCAVREVFTVSGNSQSVSSVAVRLERIDGSGPITVRLETEDGTLVEQGAIAASSTPLFQAWATIGFVSSHVLRSGVAYHLMLTAPGDTTYAVFAIRKGSSYEFDPRTYFADGHGEVDEGSGWVGFDQPGGTPHSPEGDLQFYFR
jgi:hypothetical protein